MHAGARRSRTTGFRVLTSSLSLAALCVASAVTSPAQGAGGIIEDGAPPDFALLYTGDVIGYIDPCG